MFRPKPFKNAEVNPEPPRRDSRDYIELISNFLWFHHKKFVALALLIGLGFWIAYVVKKPRTGQPTSSTKANTRSRLDDAPTTQLVIPQSPTTLEPNSPTTSESDSATTPDLKTNNPPGATNLPGPPKKGSFEWLLENGSVDKLIEESLRLAGAWGKAPPGVGLKLNADRVAISQQLLNMNLTESERRYAIITYVDAISLVDTLNFVSEMGVEGTREALKEIGEKYSNHPDETVRAKTHLAIALVALYEFKKSKTASHLDNYEAALVANFDSIALDGPSLKRLTDLATVAQRESTGDVKATRVSNLLIQRLTNLETPLARTLAGKLAHSIAFQTIDLSTLPILAQNSSSESVEKINQFFDVLEEHPNSPLGTYEIAINCILQYQRIGNFKRVVETLDRLQPIVKRIENPEKQKAVQDIIDRMKTEFGL